MLTTRLVQALDLRTHLTTNQKVEKCAYIGQILSVVALCLAKLSLIQVLVGLTPVKRMLVVFNTVAVFIVLWGVAAILTLALQCKLSRPWITLGERCVDRVFARTMC